MLRGSGLPAAIGFGASARRLMRLCAPAVGALTLAACVINPVTGQRELALVSADEEISIGQAQYAPSRQMQGGDYVLSPSVTDYVSTVGQALADVSDRALPYEFVVLNSSVPNAWALPGGKIAVNRGLLIELGSEAELAAVLGHEIVHAAARHGAQAMQRGLLLQGALVVAGVAARNNDYSGLAVGAASIGAQLINQRHGREAELEADEYGMRYMSRAAYDPSAAVTLQETFVRLSGDRGEEGWLAGLFASHPPSAERVAQNRATAAALPPTGEMGREAYRAAIAPLLESQPAYEAHDDARAALAAGDAARAEELAQQAVRLLPGEAQFYGLLGDIDASQRRFDDAIRHYADAVARNDRFFYYRLQRGRAYRELGQRGPARADLEASVALLPTADAHLGLGAIAEREGDVARALEHYRAAAGASGPAGEAAAEAVVRLDLPANPAQYIGIRTAVDSGGRLVVEVANTTRVSIRNVRLAIRYAYSAGAVRTARPGIADTLAPGAVVRVATGLGPFTSAEAYDVAVESAQVATQ